MLSLCNAGGPSVEWIEHCRRACMVCGPEPFDPNCDCQAIFGARCLPPLPPFEETETPEQITESWTLTDSTTEIP